MHGKSSGFIEINAATVSDQLWLMTESPESPATPTVVSRGPLLELVWEFGVPVRSWPPAAWTSKGETKNAQRVKRLPHRKGFGSRGGLGRGTLRRHGSGGAGRGAGPRRVPGGALCK